MLIITGTVAYDYIMDFPGKFGDHILPYQTHNINLSFIVNNFAKRRGGTAGNVSYTLGLLQTPNILFSAAGKDFEDYKTSFKMLEMSTMFVLIDPQQYTSTGFAMTDKANNQIWGYFYGAAEKISNLKLSKVAKKDDLVLVGPSGAKGSMSFVRQCIDLHVDYMFDPGFVLTQISDKDLILGISHAAYIVGNDYEITVIKQRVTDWKKIFAKKVIITTLGEKGAVIQMQGKKYTIAVVKPNNVVDPTGAGDGWRAGFLAGIAQGKDLQIAGQMGSVAASFAIEKYGTQEHTFTVNEFYKRYVQTFKKVLTLH